MTDLERILMNQATMMAAMARLPGIWPDDAIQLTDKSAMTRSLVLARLAAVRADVERDQQRLAAQEKKP